ncbi:MAG: MalY/PatB family protein [Chloroflexota bacterium]
MTNFDQPIDRHQFPTMKWQTSYLTNHFGNPDAIPMSVADMDFPAPPAVVAQLQQRAAHAVFGYGYQPDSYFPALEAWYRERHGWQLEQEQLEQCPSILSAITILIEQHSQAGNGVIVQPPVFFEFRMVIRSNGRSVVKNPLKLENGRYTIDFDDLEAKTADPNNKILILCNPHNPVGRVWTKEELAEVADICQRNGVFVISDEIHSDFAFTPHSYTPYLTVASGENAAACISPGKTFNISGLVDALAVIPNKKHREQFHHFAHCFQINKTNVFAVLATEIAYRKGGAWLDDLLAYLQGNVAYMRSFLADNDINVSLIEPEGTFLVWLDFRELGMDVKVLAKFLAQQAGLALSPGYWYGREGAGFARMTIGCPRQTIALAMEQLATAIKTLS